MSMIECPECGKEVSDNAVMCPNCGYGVKEHFSKIESEEVRKQNEEKRKEVINFRNCVTCNVCNLEMFNTMCGCAVGRAEGHRDWIRNL